MRTADKNRAPSAQIPNATFRRPTFRNQISGFAASLRQPLQRGFRFLGKAGLGGSAGKFLEETVAKAGSNKFAILPFAKEPGQLQTDRSPHAPREEFVSRSETTTMGTNLESALEAAIALLPPGYVPSVVLVSDGNETLGNGLKAALKAGLPVSTVPLPTRNEPEVQVSAVALPAQVRQGN